jgi:DUF1365 family protein
MAQDVGEKYQSKIHQPAENLAICVSYWRNKVFAQTVVAESYALAQRTSLLAFLKYLPSL